VLARVAHRCIVRAPQELRTARLVLSEYPIGCSRPVPLHGKPDRVYEALNGDLIVVETRLRIKPRPTLRDLVQLSIYRAILLHCDLEPLAKVRVRDYGYVECAIGGLSRYVALTLLPPATIFAWAARYTTAVTQRESDAHRRTATDR